MADKTYTVLAELLVKNDKAILALTEMSNQFSKLEKSAKYRLEAINKNLASLGNVIRTTGLFWAVDRLATTINDALIPAFNRLDTIQLATRTISVMSGSTEAATAAISELEQAVRDTPYRLDTATAAMRSFYARGVDLRRAVDYTKDAMDILIFFGRGTTEEMERVTDAIGKMLAAGRVYSDQLNRLYDAGIPATEMYAAVTGQSVIEVRKELEKGTITAIEFFDTIHKAVNEGAGRFPVIAGTAKSAVTTWAASFDVAKARITIAVASLIDSVDKAFASAFGKDLRAAIRDFGTYVGEKIKSVIPYVVKFVETIAVIIKFFKEAYNTFAPLLSILLRAGAAWFVWTVVPLLINRVIASINLLTTSLHKATQASIRTAQSLSLVGRLSRIGRVVGLAGVIALPEILERIGKTTEKPIENSQNLNDVLAKLPNTISPAENAANALENSIKKAGKAAKGILASFDEIHDITQSSADNAEDMTPAGGGNIADFAVPPLDDDFKNINDQLDDIVSKQKTWLDRLIETVEPVAKIAAIFNNLKNIRLFGFLKDFKLGEFLSQLKNTDIAKFIGNVFNAIKNSPVGKIIEPLLKPILEMLKPLEKILKPVIELLGKPAVKLGGKVLGFLAGVGEILLVIDLIKTVMDLTEKLPQRFEQIRDGIYKVFSGDVWNGIFEIIRGISGAIWDVIDTLLTNILGEEIWGSIKNAISNFAQWLLAKITEIGIWIVVKWVELQAWTREKWDAIKETISNIIMNIVAWIVIKWAELQTWTREKWNTIKETISNIIMNVVAWIVIKWTELQTWTREKWNAIKEAISNAITNAWTAVTSTVSNISSWMRQKWEEIKAWTAEKWNAIKNTISDAAAGAWNSIVSTFSNITIWISNKWEEVKNITFTKWYNIKSGIVNIFSGVIDGIKGTINIVINDLNRAIDGLNRIKINIPYWVPVLGGRSWGINIPRIPALAAGGIVQYPTIALVGEAGAEAVIPLERGRVVDTIAEKIAAAILKSLLSSLSYFSSAGKETMVRDIVLQVDSRELARATVFATANELKNIGFVVK